MTTNKDRPQKVKGNKNRKHDWSFYAIIICLLIIAIPTVWLLWEIIPASLRGGSPIIGNRFENDLDPAIKTEELDAVKAELEGLDNVSKVEIHLVTGTVRIFLEVDENADEKAMKSLAKETYTALIEKLPVETYFTSGKSHQMYDIEINVYNSLAEDNDNFIYVMANKTAMMESLRVQTVTTPVSQEVADELRRIQEEQDAPAEDNENNNSNEDSGEGE